MTFQITVTAALVLAALLGSLTSLPGLLLVAVVLQAAAVALIGNPAQAVSGVAAYGITPFNVVALMGGLACLWAWLRGLRPAWPRNLRWPLGLLLGYALVAAAGAWWLPQRFEGVPVNLVFQIYGAERAPVPLVPTPSNIVQALNLGVLAIVLLWWLTALRGNPARQRLAAGLCLAVGAVIGIGAYEQAALALDWPSLKPWLANNAGYHQAPVAKQGFGGGLTLNRMGLPFTEPSYASVYLAAVALGVMAVALLGRRWLLAVLASVPVLLGLLNTMGSTGWAAAGVALGALTLWVVLRNLRPATGLSRRLRAAGWVTLLLALSVWGQQTYEDAPWRPHVEAVVKRLIVDKATKSDGVRERSNERGLEILKETYGLGVGLGSHRASSFFVSLLANTGVLGFGLFMGMLGTLLWQYWRAPALSDMQIFIAAALPTATLGMGLGIPDLNMPMYWSFVFLGFVFCPGWETLQQDKALADAQAGSQGQPP